MFKNKIIQVIVICCLVCISTCFITMFARLEKSANNDTKTTTEQISNSDAETTTQENPNDNTTNIPADSDTRSYIKNLCKDVSNIEDFRCSCIIKSEFEIKNDKAKEIYNYITEQWQKSEEKHFDEKGLNWISLAFISGDSPPINEDDNVSFTEIYYGVFQIHENDYLMYTAAPFTSFASGYKMPDGTYNKILEMVKQ